MKKITLHMYSHPDFESWLTAKLMHTLTDFAVPGLAEKYQIDFKLDEQELKQQLVTSSLANRMASEFIKSDTIDVFLFLGYSMEEPKFAENILDLIKEFPLDLPYPRVYFFSHWGTPTYTTMPNETLVVNPDDPLVDELLPAFPKEVNEVLHGNVDADARIDLFRKMIDCFRSYDYSSNFYTSMRILKFRYDEYGGRTLPNDYLYQQLAKIDRFVDKKIKDMRPYQFQGHELKICLTDRYESEIAAKYWHNHPKCLILFINPLGQFTQFRLRRAKDAQLEVDTHKLLEDLLGTYRFRQVLGTNYASYASTNLNVIDVFTNLFKLV